MTLLDTRYQIKADEEILAEPLEANFASIWGVVNGNIGSDNIAADSIGAGHMAANAITAENGALADDCIVTDKVLDRQITIDKLSTEFSVSRQREASQIVLGNTGWTEVLSWTVSRQTQDVNGVILVSGTMTFKNKKNTAGYGIVGLFVDGVLWQNATVYVPAGTASETSPGYCSCPVNFYYQAVAGHASYSMKIQARTNLAYTTDSNCMVVAGTTTPSEALLNSNIAVFQLAE